MKNLQAIATRDQLTAIRKEASEKYDLMDWALEQRDWDAAYDLLEKGDNLMRLAARLEMRQADFVADCTAGPMTIAVEHANIARNVESCK